MPVLLYIVGASSVLFAVGMVYLELRYPVWSHVYFAGGARERSGGGGAGKGMQGGREVV